MDTNKILLTVDDIFRMKGVQPGYDPTDLEYEQAVKTADDLNKQKLQTMMMPEQSTPQYITLTNRADNSEIRGIMEGGKFREVPVDKITTPRGTFTMQTATNAAPIYLPDGSVAQNYTGDPTMGGAPAPGIGGAGMAVTNAPTAAPMQTPTPSPAPAGASSLEGKKVVQNGVTYLISNNIPHVQVNGQWVPQQ
jgi:hypothetical protein